MSGSLSPGLESALLAHTFGGVAFPQPAATWAALYVTPPSYGPGAAGFEVSGGGYLRMQAVWTAPGGVPPFVVNTQAVQWAAAASAWGTIYGVGILSDRSAGILLASGLLVDPADGVTPRPITIGQGDIFRFPINSLLIGFLAPSPAPATAGVGAGPAAVTRRLVPPPWTPAQRSLMRARPEVLRAQAAP
jgi:hypothetical protein